MDPFRILSRPVPVRWAGWRSDTLALQQAGWQLSVWEDMAYGRMQLAMKHETLQLRGLSHKLDWDHNLTRIGGPHYHNDFEDRPFEIGFMASQIMQRVVGAGMEWTHFRPIDAQPQLCTSEIRTLDDLAHFAVPLVRTQEVIVADESVEELMQRILAKQQPLRERYFEQQVRDAEGLTTAGKLLLPRPKVHAQIITLDNYRSAA